MSLPNIFQNKNIKVYNNQQDLFYGISNDNIRHEKKEMKKDIKNEIKKLFTSQNYVYKLNCIITTNIKTFNTYIIGQTNNHLITIDNELIPIKDIIDIKEKV